MFPNVHIKDLNPQSWHVSGMFDSDIEDLVWSPTSFIDEMSSLLVSEVVTLTPGRRYPASLTNLHVSTEARYDGRLHCLSIDVFK